MPRPTGRWPGHGGSGGPGGRGPPRQGRSPLRCQPVGAQMAGGGLVPEGRLRGVWRNGWGQGGRGATAIVACMTEGRQRLAFAVDPFGAAGRADLDAARHGGGLVGHDPALKQHRQHHPKGSGDRQGGGARAGMGHCGILGARSGTPGLAPQKPGQGAATVAPGLGLPEGTAAFGPGFNRSSGPGGFENHGSLSCLRHVSGPRLHAIVSSDPAPCRTNLPAAPSPSPGRPWGALPLGRGRDRPPWSRASEGMVGMAVRARSVSNRADGAVHRHVRIRRSRKTPGVSFGRTEPSWCPLAPTLRRQGQAPPEAASRPGQPRQGSLAGVRCPG